MAVVGTNIITDGKDTDGNSTATTSSVTLVAGRLYTLSIVQRTGITANPNQPTATSTGATWAVVDPAGVSANSSIVFDSDSSSRKRITVLRTMVSSNQTGTISIDCGGQNQTDILWELEEFSNVDTTGTNGSGAVVQAVAGKDEVSGGGSFTITLAAFSSANNATAGFFSSDSNADTVTKTETVGTGFTKLGSSISAMESMNEWKNSNDTTVDMSCATAAGAKMGGIAIEIKAASTTTIKTQTGVARITATTSKTQTGLSRITTTTTKAQTGKARITSTTTQTQTGKSRITVSTSKTQIGVARISNTSSQTQTGTSRITVTTSKTQTGIARVTAVTSKTQSGIARITATSSQNQSGKASILNTTTKTQTGVSRISISTSQTQTGTSRITASTSKTQTGTSNILNTTTKTQSGVSRIQITSVQTQTGVSRIIISTSKTQSGVSRITATTTKTITGVANIVSSSVGKTQTGKASILSTISKPPPKIILVDGQLAIRLGGNFYTKL